jgi:hypothetical protein
LARAQRAGRALIDTVALRAIHTSVSTPFAFTDPESRSELEPRDVTGISDELGTFSRVEGLLGEEQALLAIPAEQRTPEHHERLRVVTEELDRTWEHLRRRAHRLGIARDH